MKLPSPARKQGGVQDAPSRGHDLKQGFQDVDGNQFAMPPHGGMT